MTCTHPMMETQCVINPNTRAETRQKIVKDASRRVRSEGLNGAAVTAVMQ